MRVILIATILIYQRYIAVFRPPCCRFHPSCSNYAIIALEQHGAWRGLLLSLRRLLRCHPLCPGGLDPVPDRFPQRVGATVTAPLCASGVDSVSGKD